MARTDAESVARKLFISSKKNIKLLDALAAAGATFDRASALLYAPHKSFLGIARKMDDDWKIYRGWFDKANGNAVVEEAISDTLIYEARIFNKTAELRWLNQENGRGDAVVLCEDSAKKFFDINASEFRPNNKGIVDTIEQTYLLWGESVGASIGDWAKFAEARIGSFFVPIATITQGNQRAQFTAIEYLGEYQDGNVAVAEERLCGIEMVSTEENHHG